MAKDLHTISVAGGSSLARDDRLIVHLLPQQSFAAGNGTVTAIAAGTAGSGYQTIPTVAINKPASGAKNTGSGAAATAVMGVVANPTIAAGGSGGTNGTQTVTGTTGTGTKFQASVTIAGNAITAVLSVTVAGAYTAMPSTLTAEPVTGASLSGATLNLSAAMGVVSYTVGSAGSNYPVGFTTAALTGGSPSVAAVPGAVTVTSAAGASVVTDFAGFQVPLPYRVGVMGIDQDATAFVSNRTTAGFTVTINPRLASGTLVAGKVDIEVLA